MALDKNYLMYIQSCREHVHTAFAMGKMLITYIYKNPDTQEFMYKKDDEFGIGHRCGVIIAYKLNRSTEVTLGWALCNPKDQFNKYAGISKALARTGSKPTRVALYPFWNDMIERVHVYFKDGQLDETKRIGS